MFKAVQNLREQKGFTLIELLIVIAIIGILAAIAIPAFLGQREKAKLKQVTASAKGSVSEVQSMLDSMVMQEPIVALGTTSDGPKREACYNHTQAPTGKNCASMYAGIKVSTDDLGAGAGKYENVEHVIEMITIHHLAKEEQSIYSAGALFVDDSAAIRAGTIRLSNTTGKSIKITAYGPATGTDAFIFNTVVTAR